MKRKKLVLNLLTVAALGLWSCSDNSDGPDNRSQLTLKESLVTEAQDLNLAVNAITQSKGYQILTLQEDGGTKSGEATDSDTLYTASITIDDLKGVYDYNPQAADYGHWGMWVQNLFERTGDSEQFILRLPKEKATKPQSCFTVTEVDSTLVNDFVITTSDYLYRYSGGGSFDYLLDTRLDVADEFIGNLYVKWEKKSLFDFNYSSQYTFPNDYTVGVDFQLGDTILYAYSLEQNNEPIFKESVSLTKTDNTFCREREYSLQIGNVKIVKNSSVDSIQVYKDGTLQENATVEVISGTESTDTDMAFCRKGRDLRITFDDGTVVLLSELMGDSMDTLDQVFDSLGDVYFASKLVNRVAWSIYVNK